MRQMQLQQAQAITETFKDHLLKQTSDGTGVKIPDLRQSSNAETQNDRIKNMIRPTQLKDESFPYFHQRSKPTEFKNESFSFLSPT